MTEEKKQQIVIWMIIKYLKLCILEQKKKEKTLEKVELKKKLNASNLSSNQIR